LDQAPTLRLSRKSGGKNGSTANTLHPQKSLFHLYVHFSYILINGSGYRQDGMVSYRAIRKVFLWIVNRLEEVASAMRLNDVIGHFSKAESFARYFVEFVAFLGVLLGIEYWIRRPDIGGLTLLNLTEESPPTEQNAAGKRIAGEPEYFFEILSCASLSHRSETELMECFIFPVRGTRLYAPPPGVLQKLSLLVADHMIKINYYLIIEKGDLAHLDPKEMARFLEKLDFANDISFIFVDAEIRERYGIRNRSLTNRVIFMHQGIAFTHNRDHTGVFTSARKYSGRAARKIFSAVDRLRILAVPRDAIELSNGFRDVLLRQDLKPKNNALFLNDELETQAKHKNEEG
jgi:hypothetical protein